MKKYTDQDFIEAVKNSHSIAGVLNKLGLRVAGGNYNTVNNKIAALNLDVSHFTGQASNRGKVRGPKRPLEDYLNNKFPISSHHLRIRLLKEKVFESKCYNCERAEWLGEPIPLELEHINGIHSDNRLENLTLLCPNCHALTPTYRGKNKRKAV